MGPKGVSKIPRCSDPAHASETKVPPTSPDMHGLINAEHAATCRQPRLKRPNDSFPNILLRIFTSTSLRSRNP